MWNSAEDTQLQASTSQSPSSSAKKQRRPHKKDPRSQPPSVQLSRALSYLLRHGAEKEKLTMGSDGYVFLDEVLKKSRVRQIDMEPDNGRFTKEGKKKREPLVQDVLAIIAKPGDKTRFEIREEGSGTDKWLIRAIQGHTIESVTELDHTPITLSNLAVLDYSDRSQECGAVPVDGGAILPVGVEILHGTTSEAWEKIKESGGLNKMRRNHIHLARGRPGTPGVGSGMCP